MHSLGTEVLAGLNRALDEAERNFDALVIWHEPPFAVGANLKAALESIRSDALARHRGARGAQPRARRGGEEFRRARHLARAAVRRGREPQGGARIDQI